MSSSSLPPPIVASAPGKVILSGEHAVVHMAHALATVIHQRTFVEITTTQDDTVSLHILHPQLTEEYSWSLKTLQTVAQQYQSFLPTPSTPSPPSPSLDTARTSSPFTTLSHLTSSPATVFLLYHVLITGATTACKVRVKSELPMGAGLGSSASFCAALATAFYHLYHRDGRGSTSPLASTSTSTSFTPLDHSIINTWAYEGERVLHGNPSGVDNTCSVYGGVIMYKKGQPITFLKQLPSVHLLITNTRISRDTKRLVAGVGTLLSTHPTVIQPILTSMDAISQSWCHAIHILQHGMEDEKKNEEEKQKMQQEFNKEVASLIRINQSLLNAIGVGHPSIDSIVSIARKYDIASKLTGAGGGGCVISLLSSDDIHHTSPSTSTSQFRSELLTHGFEAFHTQIGKDGIRIHLNMTLEQLLPEESVSEISSV